MSVCHKKKFWPDFGIARTPSATNRPTLSVSGQKIDHRNFWKSPFLGLFWAKNTFFVTKIFFRSQMMKNAFWGLFLFPKTCFMHFLAKFDKIKIWIFGVLWGSKMVIFQLLHAFLDFFFQNFFLLQKCQEMIKKRFSRLLLALKIILIRFWTRYDNSKTLNFFTIFH